MALCNVDTHYSAWSGLSYDGLMENSSIETIYIEEPEGLVGWEGQGLVPIFWVVGEAVAIVLISIKSQIL